MTQAGSKKYIECLNDLMDYFILADIQRLSRFVADYSLSDDLITEFTTTDYGDLAVNQGVMIPLRGIENFPYTVYFNQSSKSAFSALESDVQHRKAGYVLEVTGSRLYLLTMPLLRHWSKNVEFIQANRPYFDLENGWYSVEILCGETVQDSGWEPTIEFLLERKESKPDYHADFTYPFTVTSREY